MVRDAYRDHPRTQELFNLLRDHLSQLAAPHPDVTVHQRPVAYVV
jgi:hypothetical protein